MMKPVFCLVYLIFIPDWDRKAMAKVSMVNRQINESGWFKIYEKA